jgi:hypothetical protein
MLKCEGFSFGGDSPSKEKGEARKGAFACHKPILDSPSHRNEETFPNAWNRNFH